MITIHLTVNGKPVTTDVRPEQTLLSMLRDNLELTGTKESCSVGECGACTVVADGQAVKSCCALAAQYDGSEIITIEGLTQNGQMHPLQQAFVDAYAVQCGFCIPGFIMAAYALLLHNQNPSKEEIVTAISGNLCRCTGYENIIAAIELYVHRLNNPEPEPEEQPQADPQPESTEA